MEEDTIMPWVEEDQIPRPTCRLYLLSSMIRFPLLSDCPHSFYHAIGYNERHRGTPDYTVVSSVVWPMSKRQRPSEILVLTVWDD